MLKIYLSLLLIILTSCNSNSKRESPSIYMTNASPDFIRNIEVKWATKNVLKLTNLNPGDSRTQSFYIKKSEEFFGDVEVFWYNSKNEKMSKSFTIKLEHLPNINDKYGFNYVQFYFSQDDAEVITSDIIDINGKTKMMDRLIIKYKAEAQNRGIYADCVPNRLNLYNCNGNGAAASVLIRVQTLQ